MAVIGFAGTPGSGKTYDAVVKIINNLKSGRTVYTNIRGMDDPLCQQVIMALAGIDDYGIACRLNHLTDDETLEFWNHVEPGCLIIIDEVQNFFGSREWQSEKNQSFGRWASTHRHFGYEVVLITQDVDRIDTLVRSLLEWTYVYRKVNFFGGLVNNSYLCYSYGGSEVNKKHLVMQTKFYDKKIFLAYKSYVAKDVKEMGIMKHANVLKHPVFFAIPVVFAITIYMVFFKSGIGTGDVFGHKKAMAQAQIRKTEHHKAPAGTLPAQNNSPGYSVPGSQIRFSEKDNSIKYTNRGPV